MYEFIIYILCSSCLFVMGLYALIDNPKSKSNRAFFIMSLFFAAWILSLYLGYYYGDSRTLSLTFIRLADGFPLLAILFLSRFMYYFPTKSIKLPKFVGIVYSLLLSATFFITVFTPLVQTSITISNGELISETLGPLFDFFMYLVLISIILITVFVIKKLYTLHGIEKIKLKIIIFAFVGVATFTSLTNLILPQFGILFYVKESILFTLLFIGPTLYAIHKHRFFHISSVALNILRLLIFAGCYTLLVLLLLLITQSIYPKFNELTKLLIIGGISLIIFYKIEKYFPKFKNKSLQQFSQMIDKLKSKIYYCENINKLTDHIENTFLRSFNIKNVKLYIIRQNFDNQEFPIFKQNEFTEILKQFKEEIIVLQEIQYKKISEKKRNILEKTLKNLNGIVCLPLFAEENLIGFFILGAKSNNIHYSKGEIKEIKRLQKDLELSMMNNLLKLNLQEENNLMKDIIEKKTEKLREQFQDIKALLEQQSDFIAVTAHEFRTPLSIAMFQLEDTLSAHKHAPQVVKDMSVMGDSLNNLKTLTQQMFDVQQYDLNTIKLNKLKVDILAYTKQIFSEFSLIMKEKNIEFNLINNLKNEIQIEIDEQQIRQIFSNLLNNAIKFSNSDNPKISIEISDNSDVIQISIIDNGEGIPDKDKERIFEKFQTTKVSMGTGIGLGLYICKKIIELHKGKIWTEDHEEGGTKFIFELRK